MSTNDHVPSLFEEILVPGHAYTVISLHPICAWAVMFGGKDIENRSVTTQQRGRVLIHASEQKGSLREEQDLRSELSFLTGIARAELPVTFLRNAILGSVEITDSVHGARSKWAVPEQHHWLLQDPRQLAAPVHGVTGKPLFWSWTQQRKSTLAPQRRRAAAR